MARDKKGFNGGALLYSIAVLVVAAFAICYLVGSSERGALAQEGPEGRTPESPSATFAANAGSLGAIPDGTALTPGAYGAPRDVTFTVTGLSGTITSVSVNFTSGGPAHTFVGDVEAVLKAPGGSPSHILFARTGATSTSSFGSGSDITGPYNFTDTATGTNWWTAAATTPIPTGDYRTVVTGPTTNPAAVSTMNPVFAAATANGTWTLSFRDGASTDTGAISAANLTITTGGSPTPTPPDALADFDGDGKTDYAVIRSAAGPSGQATWHVSLNATGVPSSRDWGLASDTFVPADYDQDGKDDIAVWRPGVQGTFYIIQSATNTIRVDDFGTAGDDASVVGDYNNDGRDDLAVYRSGATPGSFSFWYWKSGGTVYAVQWGLNGDFVAPGDYDGDGAMDFAVQRNNGANADYYRRFSSGIPSTVTTFGLANDIVIPGDYDGDLKTDLAAIRPSGANWLWVFRKSSNGSDISNTWGLTATDYPAPGDYTGDGKADYAVWRFGALSTFHVMTPETLQISSRQWGLVDDVPATLTYTH